MDIVHCDQIFNTEPLKPNATGFIYVTAGVTDLQEPDLDLLKYIKNQAIHDGHYICSYFHPDVV